MGLSLDNDGDKCECEHCSCGEWQKEIEDLIDENDQLQAQIDDLIRRLPAEDDWW